MFVTIVGLIIVVSMGIVYLITTSKNKNKKGDVRKSKEERQIEGIKNSHKVVEKKGKEIPQKDIADFMEFEKISDNMIIQNKGQRFTMVVQCKGINYDLMSEVEQMAVEEGFITFLNTLKFPIQLYVQARAVDLKQNLNIYKKSVSESESKFNEINDKYRNLVNNIDADYTEINNLKNEVDKQQHILEYAQDITRYVERISLNKSILQRKFYVVLSYNKSEITSTSDFSELEVYNICYRELYTRAQTLISALMGCSVVGKVLSSNELAELLYISYNRDDEKLLDIKTALESGFYRLYSTSKDVFEKKEEAMQREVEEEAKRRVQDAVDEILKNQEQKTKDELIEEYEDRVDREALKIIDESDTTKEAKTMLKNTIVENHVIGVETRKIDRKLKKENSEKIEKSKEVIAKPSDKEKSTHNVGMEDTVVKKVEEEKEPIVVDEEKEEENLQRETKNTENEDVFYDDRLGSSNSEEDTDINI